MVAGRGDVHSEAKPHTDFASDARADGERIEQVLFNLVDNAIKYGRTSGHVTLRGERLADGRASVSVQDDGPGVPSEARERFFERFYRVGKARSREQGGTGLGLAIVKHIIQRHGGEVSLQSEAGHGSTFSFTLPSAKMETMAAVAPDGAASTAAGGQGEQTR